MATSERTGGGVTNHYVPFPKPTEAHPCPDCGRCPNCGRGGSYPTWPTNPYYPWWENPYGPKWIVGDQVPITPITPTCGSDTWSVSTSAGLALGDVKGVSLSVQPSTNAYLN